MKHSDITKERNFEHAARRLADVERFARRRAALIDALDLSQLGISTLRKIARDDEDIDFQIASGHLYLAYLANVEGQKAYVAAVVRAAAASCAMCAIFRPQA